MSFFFAVGKSRLKKNLKVCCKGCILSRGVSWDTLSRLPSYQQRAAMKKIVLTCLSAAALLACAMPDAVAAQFNQPPKTYARIGDAPSQTRFTKAIEDLPLMPGLELDDKDDVVFIFGSSRIAQTTAKGFVDIDSVYYFYQDTLPQLGWRQINPKLYSRENELLHVEARSANSEGITYVRFEVKPEQR